MTFASMEVFNEVGKLSNHARYRDSGLEEPEIETRCLLSRFEMCCGRVLPAAPGLTHVVGCDGARRKIAWFLCLEMGINKDL